MRGCRGSMTGRSSFWRGCRDMISSRLPCTPEGRQNHANAYGIDLPLSIITSSSAPSTANPSSTPAGAAISMATLAEHSEDCGANLDPSGAWEITSIFLSVSTRITGSRTSFASRKKLRQFGLRAIIARGLHGRRAMPHSPSAPVAGRMSGVTLSRRRNVTERRHSSKN